MIILDELLMKVTFRTQDINRTSWTSSKRFVYVQFRYCSQWVNLFESLKLSNIKLLISGLIVGCSVTTTVEHSFEMWNVGKKVSIKVESIVIIKLRIKSNFPFRLMKILMIPQ